MIKNCKKFLSFLLAFAMILSLWTPSARADQETKSQSPAGGSSVEVTDLDPATLPVKRLGDDFAMPLAEEEKILYGPNDLVRVSIFLDENAALDAGFSAQSVGKNEGAQAYRAKLKASQDAMQRSIEAATGEVLDVQWNLTLVTNAISAYVRYKNLDVIRQMKGVKSVELEAYYEAPDPVAQPMTGNTVGEMTETLLAWADGYTGAGRRIAIIDTGIDITHISFAEEPFLHAIDEVRAGGKTVELMTEADIPSGLHGSGIYVSAKIPFAYNYVDKNTTNLGHDTDKKGNHGSHVAGISAGNRYVQQNGQMEEAITAVKAVGMAPDAQLLLMKVFGAGGGAYESDYMVAIEDAMAMGCDAANLSLGSAAPGFTYSDSYQKVMNSLTSADNEGMVVVISAGNSYAFTYAAQTDLYIEDVKMHTGGSPGTFINSLGVASADNIGRTYNPISFNNGHLVSYAETESTGGKLSEMPGTYEYIYLDCYGAPEDYAAAAAELTISGKVLIVNRGGNINFSAKGNDAIAYSPTALIVANNQAGTISMSLGDYTGTFPMVSIPLEDAARIKTDSSASGTVGGIDYYCGTLTVVGGTIPRDQARMSAFSSWGVPGSLLMKPEITAPGGNIYSVYGTSNNATDIEDGQGPDVYGYMSGTSMAAPHISGITAVIAQYLAENPIADWNAELAANYSTRAILQSLLMSTATPMTLDGNYVSLLQQGAGLVDTARAVKSGSVIMMEDAYLTTMTGSDKDGKVKVELGEDAAREGVYTIALRIYNISELSISFTPSLDMFTQDSYAEGNYRFMKESTTALNGVSMSWAWEGPAQTVEHDVNKDGSFTELDPQAVLEYLVGNVAASELDLAAAEMDGVDGISSYDAQLLMRLLEEEGPQLAEGIVAPGQSLGLTLTITLNENLKTWLASQYPTGNYLEGFLTLSGEAESAEGVAIRDEHSVAILGFFGSWTDPSMFDNNSLIDRLYGSTKIPYSGNTDTNYLILDKGRGEKAFTGNPYMAEPDGFPADSLAVRSDTVLKGFSYNLIRDAATTAVALSLIAEPGAAMEDILYASILNTNQGALYYHVNNKKWMNTDAQRANLNRTPASMGLAEGDYFRVGYYAIPEYYGMVNTWEQGGDVNGRYASLLSQTWFEELLGQDRFGSGAGIVYDFIIDDTTPTMADPVIEGTNLTLELSDNLKLAYVALMSLDGLTVYEEYAPGQASYTLETDIADLVENARGYVALFAADYAGNEIAKAIKVNENTSAEKSAYVLTDTLEAGGEYIISTANIGGDNTALALSYADNNGTKSANGVALIINVPDENYDKPYVTLDNVPAASVWTAEEMEGGYSLNNEGTYMGWSYASYSANLLFGDTVAPWQYINNKLIFSVNTGYSTWKYGIRYSGNGSYQNWSLYTTESYFTNFYLYKKVTESYEQDPYKASFVGVRPGTLALYVGGTSTLEADVQPMTVDKSVIWESLDPTIATVDENGLVTAVAKGQTTITATSTTNEEAVGRCTVIVEQADAALDAIIWDANGAEFFGAFNTEDRANWTSKHATGYDMKLQNAFMYDANTLIAANLSSGASNLYSVDRNTHAVTLLGPSKYPVVGIAAGPAKGNDAGTQYADYVYAFASYLIAASMTLDDEGMLGNYLTLGQVEKNVNLAGLALKGRTDTGAVYYVLDEQGRIWEVELYYSSYGYAYFKDPVLVVDTGIECSSLYQGFYFDGSYIYWTRFDMETYTTELIIINPELGTFYRVGQFNEESIMMIPALYKDGQMLPTTASTVTEEDPSRVLTDEQMAAIEAELQAAAKELANRTRPVAGSTQAVSVEVSPTERRVVLSNENGTQSVVTEAADYLVIREDTDVTNGILEIHFDPAEVEFVRMEGVPAYAYSVDAENGILKIAYAAAEVLTAGTELFKPVFAAGCEDQELTVVTLERNSDLSLNESAVLTLEGEGHVWNTEPVWAWEQDYSAATATFTCTKNEDHQLVLDAAIDTQETDEKIIYTATVTLDGKTYTDTQEVEKAADLFVTIDSVALTMANRIDANIYLKVPEEAVKAVITYSHKGWKVPDEQEYVFSNMNLDDEGRYQLDVINIPAKELIETMTLQVLDENGTPIKLVMKTMVGTMADETTYVVSAADYANVVVEKGNEQQQKQAKSLLVYGSMVQRILDHKTDNLAASDEILEEMKAEMDAVQVVSDYDGVLPEGDDKTNLGYQSLSLNMEGEIQILLRFSKKVTATMNGKALQVQRSNGGYEVVIPHIRAKNMDVIQEVKVTYGSTSFTFKVCALTYANRILATANAPQDYINLAKAMYIYQQETLNLFGRD